MRALLLPVITSLLMPLYTSAQPRSLINKGDTIRYLPYQNGRATFSYNGKMGVIDSTGKVIIPATFSWLSRLFDDEDGFSYRFYYDKKKQGVLDKDLNIVIPADAYDDIDIRINGFFKVKKNGNYSFINKEGKCFDKWFEESDFFMQGLAPVKLEGKWGFINTTGEMVIPNTYSKAKTFSQDGLAAVKGKAGWGFVDVTGKVIIPLMYERVNFFNNGSCSVRKNGKWIHIDKQGNEIYNAH